MENPGDLILEVITKNKVKQKDFASDCQISPSMLNELISGRTKLNVYTAIRIEKNYPDFDSREALRRQIEIIYKQEIG